MTHFRYIGSTPELDMMNNIDTATALWIDMPWYKKLIHLDMPLRAWVVSLHWQRQFYKTTELTMDTYYSELQGVKDELSDMKRLSARQHNMIVSMYHIHMGDQAEYVLELYEEKKRDYLADQDTVEVEAIPFQLIDGVLAA